MEENYFRKGFSVKSLSWGEQNTQHLFIFKPKCEHPPKNQCVCKKLVVTQVHWYRSTSEESESPGPWGKLCVDTLEEVQSKLCKRTETSFVCIWAWVLGQRTVRPEYRIPRTQLLAQPVQTDLVWLFCLLPEDQSSVENTYCTMGFNLQTSLSGLTCLDFREKVHLSCTQSKLQKTSLGWDWGGGNTLCLFSKEEILTAGGELVFFYFLIILLGYIHNTGRIHSDNSD
jgi:hypothetical protein